MRKRMLLIMMVFLTAMLGVVSNSANAIPLNLIQNGDFEQYGGSLAGWFTYGDVSLYTDPNNNNHMALLGANQTSGASFISQPFMIYPGDTNQELSFWYKFDYVDTDWGMDIFVVRVDDSSGSTTQTPLNLASVNGGQGVQGSYSSLLNPQLSTGQYYLRFKLRESTSNGTDSKAYIDNVALNVSRVPEPGALLLLGSGLVCLRLIFRKKRSI